MVTVSSGQQLMYCLAGAGQALGGTLCPAALWAACADPVSELSPAYRENTEASALGSSNLDLMF